MPPAWFSSPASTAMHAYDEISSHGCVHWQPRPPQLHVGLDSALSPATGLHHWAHLQLAPSPMHLPNWCTNPSTWPPFLCAQAKTCGHSSRCPQPEPPELLVDQDPLLSPVTGLTYLQPAPPAVQLNIPGLTPFSPPLLFMHSCGEITTTGEHDNSQDLCSCLWVWLWPCHLSLWM